MMRSSIAAVLFSCLAFAGCKARENEGFEGETTSTRVARRSGELARLELIIPSGEVESGQIVKFTAKLVNTSGHRLWINKRLGFNDEHAPRQLREIWLRVRGPDNRAIGNGCIGNFPDVSAGDYAVFEPGQSFSKEYDLACFSMRPLGRYQIMAFYQDGQEHPPLPPEGVPPLAIEIKSNVVEILVR